MEIEPACVLPVSQGNGQLLYFTSTSLLADDAHLIYLSDRTGHPNLFLRALDTGLERQLTGNAEGYLKSYVYFDGRPYQGLGKASISVDPRRGIAYFIQGRGLFSVDREGKQRQLAEYPAGQVTAFTHISADGARLCVPTTDARALEGGPLAGGKPDYDIDARIREEGLSSYLRIYDTQTGQETACERVPGAWITHVQFSPADPNLVLYNHEWPSDCGIRRMWIWDGTRHRRLRAEGNGRSRNDWACHEMWERDGQAIIYHGRHAEGPAFIGRVTPDGAEPVEISLPAGWTRYGHFTEGRPGLLVSDGYCETENDGEPKGCGAWISLLDVDWDGRRIQWTPLCRHGSSWSSQDAHPHPIFNHRADAVYFTSDRGGARSIYRAALPAA